MYKNFISKNLQTQLNEALLVNEIRLRNSWNNLWTAVKLWHLQEGKRRCREGRYGGCALMAHAASDLALAGSPSPPGSSPFPCVTSFHKPTRGHHCTVATTITQCTGALHCQPSNHRSLPQARSRKRLSASPPAPQYRIPNGPPGPNPKQPGTIKPSDLIVPCPSSHRTEMAAQARH